MGQRLNQFGKATAAILALLIPPMVGRDEMADAIGFVENAGVPSAVVPAFIGQKLRDMTNNHFYVSYGVAAGEWAVDGLGGGATAAEITRAADVSARIVNLTAAALAVTEALHDGKTITVNKADGSTITLPAATGSGSRFRIFVGTTITSVGLVIKVADATDTMAGVAIVAQDAADTAVVFETAATSDTITLNGTTTGGIKGDLVELEDVAADLYHVRITASATGTEATPFSATV